MNRPTTLSALPMSEDTAKRNAHLLVNSHMLGSPSALKVQPAEKRPANLTGKIAPQEIIGFFAAYRLPAPLAEYRFDEKRRWRFDYAWPSHMVALEVEGGIWTSGRHTRGKGFAGDMEKYNRAAVLGWRVVRVEPRKLISAETAGMIKGMMEEGA